MQSSNNIPSFGSRIIPSPILYSGFDAANEKMFGYKTRRICNDFYKSLDSLINDGKNDVIKFSNYEEVPSSNFLNIKILVNDKEALKRKFRTDSYETTCRETMKAIIEFAKKRNPKLKTSSMFPPKLEETRANLKDLKLKIWS